MEFDSTTFAVSLELCIVLFCAFSIIYLGNLKNDQNRWLLFAYFAMGFSFLNVLLGEERYGILPYSPFLQNPSTVLLFFPAIYLYTLKLVKPDALSGGRAYLLFIPFVLFYGTFVVMGLEHPKGALFQSKPPFYIIAFITFNVLHTFVYLILTLKLVQYTQRHYQEQFADNSPFITLSWIKWTIYIIIATVALYLFTTLTTNDNQLSRITVLISMLSVLFILSYYSFQQPQLYTDEHPLRQTPHREETDSKPSSYSKSADTPTENSLSDQEKAVLIQRLEQVMLTQQPFLDPKIRMPELAKSLDIPRHVFSNLINEHYQVNFFHFINKYRVEYAQQLLNDKEYENYTLESIGELSGFNSRSTFNRIFKTQTGQTPKEYQNG